ncbi:MAG: hypothetical protein AAGC56_03220 [Pseudomonadota bacterium]
MAFSLTALAPRWLRPTHRVFLGVFFNYAVLSTLVTASALAMSAAGCMAMENALMWAIFLAFFAYPGLLLWCFAERRAWRIWTAFSLVGGMSLWVVAALGGDAGFGFR